jgi:hypothetical protein
MKRLIIAAITILFATTVFAQDNQATSGNDDMKTLFGGKEKTTIGWFVGPAGGIPGLMTTTWLLPVSMPEW